MSEIRPFFIWFQHRSGSTHLVSLLNSHPEIQCKGEIFGCLPLDSQANAKADGIQYSNTRIFGDREYRRIINQFPGRVEDPSDNQGLAELNGFLFRPLDAKPHPQIRGFKYKFPSQASVFPEVANELVQRASEINLIVLGRKNYLRRAISVMNLSRIQSATNKANINHPIELPPTEFDAAEIIRLIKYYASIESDFHAWTNAFPHRFELDYNDLTDSTVLLRMQDFVGVQKAVSLKSKTHKITPGDLRAHVTNIDDIYAALRQEGISFDPNEPG